MNEEHKKKNDKPSSNFEEVTPKGKVDKGEKAVKKPEDKDYTKDEATSKKSPKQKEREEQPVDPIKTPPKENQ